jgi:hypothetical protein
MLRRLRLLTRLLHLLQGSKNLKQRRWERVFLLCVFPICLVSIMSIFGPNRIGPAANAHMQHKAFGKQSTTSASTGPITDATTKTSTTPTPDKSASEDIPQSVLQAQETSNSIISSMQPAGSDVGVRGKESFKIVSDALHKLDTTSSTGPNQVTSEASIIPSVPEPTDKPNAGETTTPFKRAPDDVLTPPPDIKRIKTYAPLRSPSSVSPGPRSPSVEMQLAEKRKRVESTRKQRAELAEKRSRLEERLAPHKQRMAAELEQAEQELAEEEAMKAEEEEEYKAKQMLLAEYEGGDSAF